MNNHDACWNNAAQVAQCVLDFKPGHWSSLERGEKKKRDGSMTNTINGEWVSTAKIMMQEFVKSGQSVLKCSFPLSRGVLKCKRGKETIQYNAEPNSAEMLMKTIVSVSQSALSICRAVLICFREKRSDGDKISPDTDLNNSHELVTKLSWHEI